MDADGVAEELVAVLYYFVLNQEGVARAVHVLGFVDVDAVVLHLVEVDGVFGDALDNLYLPPSSAPCEQGADYCDK